MRSKAHVRRHSQSARSLSVRLEEAAVYGLAYSFVGLCGFSLLLMAYWIKSAAGIDFLAGHSPLHGLFY